jgi:hypothetical protein
VRTDMMTDVTRYDTLQVLMVISPIGCCQKSQGRVA